MLQNQEGGSKSQGEREKKTEKERKAVIVKAKVWRKFRKCVGRILDGIFIGSTAALVLIKYVRLPENV